MKTQSTSPNRNHSASVLLATMGICLILGILAASYLSMAQSQRYSVARAQAWNSALAVAEAGIEEAMAELNDTNAFKSYSQPGNKWNTLSGGTLFKTNIYLGSSYYNVFIYSQSNSAAPLADSKHPVIISSGFVPGPISTPMLSRTVQLQAAPITKVVPDGAMVVRTTVDVSGYNVSTDSYQSTNQTLFPGGLWNAANRMDHGDVSTLSSDSSALNLQNGKFRGSVHTPPSWTASSANIGSGGTVGDNAWVGGGNTGIETSHATNDAIQAYPEATLPDTGGKPWLPALSIPTVINGFTYQYVLTPNNPWIINNLSGSIYVKGANVQLQLTGTSATIPSGGKIEVPTLTDASGNPYSLAMYVAAPSFTVVGTGVANEGGAAKNLQYYGLPSNTAITLGGNGSLTAQIYAPEAAFSLGGGGSTPYDFSGMCVVKSVKMNGHFNFHFDECTKDTLNLRGYTAKSWDEL